MTKLFFVSIVTPTLNNGKILQFFFNHLRHQTYKNIECLIVDGGSTDNTLKIAKKNKARIIKNPLVLSEPGVSLGMEKARGDLIIILAADNYFKDRKALEKIVNIFNDKTIYAAFPKHDSQKNFSIFSKYHNVFTDPFNHFVYGEAANARTFHRIYKTLFHNKIYDIYDYAKSPELPMIALAQGFTVRAPFKRKKQDYFDDCQPIIEIIKARKKIAYIHSLSIYHNTTSDLNHFIRKQRWATQNALEKKSYGISFRQKNLSAGQKLRIKLWPFYALSFVLPTLRAIWGLVEDREPLWLFHPINCWFSAAASLQQVILYNINKIRTVSRQ
jgi:glycosyltransferase involved in cell wall biosynthesis